MANSRLCSIPDCDKPHYCNGFCKMHYTRILRHGDPSGGRTPRGEPLRWVHEVALSHTGNDCLMWPYSRGDHGYGKLTTADGKRVGAHRYLCELVHGAPPTTKHEAAHSCGRGHLGCVSLHHLEWKTRAENEADKLIHNTHQRGERHGRSKLTERQVIEIINLKGIESQINIAKRFGVSPGTVADIHCGKKWAWLTGVPNSSLEVIIE